jgi:hypothetical protein
LERMTIKRIVLVDSSSAILMYKAGLIDTCGKAYKLAISRSVMNELIVPGHEGAEYFERLITGGVLTVSYGYKGCLLDLPLSGGERDIVLLYLSGQGEFIIVDDGEGAAYCRANGIPYINALLVPSLLHYAGALGTDDSRRSRDLLVALGRYSESVKQYAERCTVETLKDFMP